MDAINFNRGNWGYCGWDGLGRFVVFYISGILARRTAHQLTAWRWVGGEPDTGVYSARKLLQPPSREGASRQEVAGEEGVGCVGLFCLDGVFFFGLFLFVMLIRWKSVDLETGAAALSSCLPPATAVE